MDKFKNVISESDISLLLGELSDIYLVHQIDALSTLQAQHCYPLTVLSVLGDILYQLMLTEATYRFENIVLSAESSVEQM